MIQLMELGTSLRTPGSFILEDPDKWEDSIKDFLQKTQHATGEELQKVRKISWLELLQTKMLTASGRLP